MDDNGKVQKNYEKSYDETSYHTMWFGAMQCHMTSYYIKSWNDVIWNDLVSISRAALASHALHREIMTLILCTVHWSALSVKQGGKFLPWGSRTCPKGVENIYEENWVDVDGVTVK